MCQIGIRQKDGNGMSMEKAPGDVLILLEELITI